jgi:hypothetical protein
MEAVDLRFRRQPLVGRGRRRRAVDAVRLPVRFPPRAHQPELEHLDVAVIRDEDIRRLEVAVDQAAAMHGGDAVDQLNRQIEHPVLPQSAGYEHGVQPTSFEQLAHQKRVTAFLAGIVNRADMRMTDERRDVGLAPEALPCRGAGAVLGRQHLDGDVTIERQVFGAEDRRVVVAPQPVDEPVVRDDVADLRGGLCEPAVVHLVAGCELVRRARSSCARRSSGSSGSAFFQICRSSSYSRRLLSMSPLIAHARPSPSRARGMTGANGSLPR